MADDRSQVARQISAQSDLLNVHVAGVTTDWLWDTTDSLMNFSLQWRRNLSSIIHPFPLVA